MPYRIEVTHFLNREGWSLFSAWYLTLQELLEKSAGFMHCSYHLNIILRRATVCMVFSDQQSGEVWLGSLHYEEWMEMVKAHQTTDAKITPLRHSRGYQ